MKGGFMPLSMVNPGEEVTLMAILLPPVRKQARIAGLKVGHYGAWTK
ncbi:MAG: hypothetical protein AB1711_12410 [Thermodesulfobacteriota bacterium]